MIQPESPNLAAFCRRLNQYTQPFTLHDDFELLPGQTVAYATRDVLDLPGIYLIFGRRASDLDLLNIGKSGTMNRNGTFKGQTLRLRLTRGKQGSIPRRDFFPQQLADLQLDALRFYWYVTFTDTLRILPAKAEADLLQIYFNIW
jgi:hypothetical protein